MRIRHILTFALLAVASLAASAATPKYIFYFIGDGMGMGPVMAAETYNRTILNNPNRLLMMQFPVASAAMTYSASSNVTDSAAAGTALSTGTKTKNSMLGMAPDTTDVYSIAVDLAKLGYGIGIGTTVAADDATPGAFYAHVPNRGMSYEIDTQFATSGVTFLAGAGLRSIKNDKGEYTDVLDRLAANNYQVVYGPDGINDIKSDKVVLLSPIGTDANNAGYTIDSIAGSLNITQITEACLKQLQKTSPEHFFMMIEGGNIDHALHANDGGAAIKEILSFNEALEVAYRFYQQHPDETLIVVTADHDTGGMSLIGPKGAKGGLANIDYQRVSKEVFGQYCEGILRSRMVYTWNDMKEYLSDKLGFWSHIKLSDDQTAKLKDLFTRTFELRNTADQKTLYANFNAFAVEVFRIFNDATGLAFTTTSHSGNPVPVYAVGAGADAFKALNNNTDIPRAILRLVKE